MYDFQVTFVITAAVKALSFAPLLLLLCLLEQEQQSMAEDADVEALHTGLLSQANEAEDGGVDMQPEMEPPVLLGKAQWRRGVRPAWQTPEVHVSGDTTPDSGSGSGPPSISSDHHSESGSVLPISSLQVQPQDRK